MDALDTLGAMICQYNREQEIALYGFGANWKNKKNVSHCFPLTKEVFVKGIKVRISILNNIHVTIISLYPIYKSVPVWR
jgi:hypothetical protein